MALDMSRFISRFVEEAREHIEQLEQGVADLEKNPSEQENINTLFRSAHTIKGSSRMLKLLTISDTAHKLEDVLGALREGSIQFSPSLAQLLLRAIDALAVLVDKAEKNAPLPEPDSDLCATLEQAAKGALNAEQTVIPSNSVIQNAETLLDNDDVSSTVTHPTSDTEIALKSSDTVRIKLPKLDELIQLMGEVVSSHSLMQQRLVDLQHLNTELNAKTVWTEFQHKLTCYQQDLRDDILAQQLLMKELHDKSLLMRMLPLAIVFDPAARLIRELARSMNKEVKCQIKGAEIELDRQIIDKLSDPIVHLLRNAVDHGIEEAQVRIDAGKPAQGLIQLSAYQEGAWVVLVISDDGGGLSAEKILKKAITKGIISHQEAATLTEKEIMGLIFLPGFSTNTIITELSGRGVGLDVVKKTIVEDLQGVIDIESHQQGTQFLLKLPLSLATMRVLLCQVAGITVGLTAQYICNLVRVPKDKLMTVADKLALNRGNEFIPVASLAELLGLKQTASSADLLLLIVKTHNEKLALMVDTLIDERDRVLKALPTHMQKLPLVTSMVMTGKNELVSILNVSQLIKNASLQYSALESRTHMQAEQKIAHILVVDDSLNTREIEKDVLEASGYQVTTAEDGMDGWQKANAGQFDAILTDVEMPRMDGFSLTQRLRQDKKFQHIPIIIITSRETEQDKLRGIEVGADAYIVKGDFEQSSLIDTLQNLLA